jgi:hypothetical protein
MQQRIGRFSGYNADKVLRQIREATSSIMIGVAFLSFLVCGLVIFRNVSAGVESFLRAPIGIKPNDERHFDWLDGIGLEAGAAGFVLLGVGSWISPPDRKTDSVRVGTNVFWDKIVAVICAGVLLMAILGFIGFLVWLFLRGN